MRYHYQLSDPTINNSFANSEQLMKYCKENPKNFTFWVSFDEKSISNISYTINIPFEKFPFKQNNIFGNIG